MQSVFAILLSLLALNDVRVLYLHWLWASNPFFGNAQFLFHQGCAAT